MPAPDITLHPRHVARPCRTHVERSHYYPPFRGGINNDVKARYTPQGGRGLNHFSTNTLHGKPHA